MKLKRHYLAGMRNYQANSLETDWVSNLRFFSLLKSILKNKQWTEEKFVSTFCTRVKYLNPPKRKVFYEFIFLLCLIFTIRWKYAELMLHINFYSQLEHNCCNIISFKGKYAPL